MYLEILFSWLLPSIELLRVGRVCLWASGLFLPLTLVEGADVQKWASQIHKSSPSVRRLATGRLDGDG